MSQNSAASLFEAQLVRGGREARTEFMAKLLHGTDEEKAGTARALAELALHAPQTAEKLYITYGPEVREGLVSLMVDGCSREGKTNALIAISVLASRLSPFSAALDASHGFQVRGGLVSIIAEDPGSESSRASALCAMANITRKRPSFAFSLTVDEVPAVAGTMLWLMRYGSELGACSGAYCVLHLARTFTEPFHWRLNELYGPAMRHELLRLVREGAPLTRSYAACAIAKLARMSHAFISEILREDEIGLQAALMLLLRKGETDEDKINVACALACLVEASDRFGKGLLARHADVLELLGALEEKTPWAAEALKLLSDLITKIGEQGDGEAVAVIVEKFSSSESSSSSSGGSGEFETEQLVVLSV